MKGCLVKLGVGLLIVVGVLAWMFTGTTTTVPHPSPPDGASNVFFYEWSAWQSWDYEYRFDATPEICEKFAIDLMTMQSYAKEGPTIIKGEFEQFPIESEFQPWFDVNSVTNGLLISGDDWIYAVVDRDRGRLYYYNSH